MTYYTNPINLHTIDPQKEIIDVTFFGTTSFSILKR